MVKQAIDGIAGAAEHTVRELGTRSPLVAILLFALLLMLGLHYWDARQRSIATLSENMILRDELVKIVLQEQQQNMARERQVNKFIEKLVNLQQMNLEDRELFKGLLEKLRRDCVGEK